MLKKTLFIIVDIVAVFAVLFGLLAIIVSARTTPGKAPSIGGYSVLYVVSPSMTPAIPVESVVIVKKITENPKVGDIIAYYSKDPSILGQLNTHRIHSITDDGKYITKGDNNPITDSKDYAVSNSEILGKVVFTSSIIGKIVNVLKNKTVFMAIILFPLALIFICSIRRMILTAKAQVKAEVEQIMSEKDEADNDKKE